MKTDRKMSKFLSTIFAFSKISDAKEKAKLDIHAALRDAVTQGYVSSVQNLLASLQKDAELIVNMAPSGANTLLFT